MAPDPAPLHETDARLALGALLVRIARSDDNYAQVEIDRINRILESRYGLSPFEASKLRVEAETLESQAPDTVRFTRAIKDSVPYDHRLSVISALWDVVLSDGKRDDEEASMMRLVANLLGISDRDSNMARKAVQDARSSH